MYRTQNTSKQSCNTWLMSILKVSGASQRPMGITRYSNFSYLVLNAVLSMSSGFTRIWWQTFIRSSFKNTCTLSNLPSISYDRVNSALLFFIIRFSYRESTTARNVSFCNAGKPPKLFFLGDDDGSDWHDQDVLKVLDRSHIWVLYSVTRWLMLIGRRYMMNADRRMT